MNIFKKAIKKAVKESEAALDALTECQTPELRKSTVPPQPTIPPMPPTTGSNAFKPNPNYTPPASVKEKRNKTMYGLKLYIPFEDLDTYIHSHIEQAHKDHTFIPIKAEITELDLGVEISLVSVVPNEIYDYRYRLDINKLPKENDKCKD